MSQNAPVIECYRRQQLGDGLYSRVEGFDQTFAFTSMGLLATLAGGVLDVDTDVNKFLTSY